MPPYDPYRLLYRHNIGSTALMRRGMVEDVAGFDSNFTGYEDWEYWVHALECGWQGRRVEAVAAAVPSTRPQPPLPTPAPNTATPFVNFVASTRACTTATADCD